MQEPYVSPDEDSTTADEKPGKRPRSYYYDDSHGYEEFDPEDEDKEDDEEESASSET